MHEFAIENLELAIATRKHCLKFSASPDKEPEKLQKQIDELQAAIDSLRK